MSGRLQALAEIALIFAIFFVDGAAPPPEVNEPYYLGKAIHYWNPDWAAGDFFLGTADTHHVFYFTFGWLSLWLKPTALAWTGRLLTWALLAWGWRRLSFAVLPRRWFAILSAALLVMLVKDFHMAGEWLIGGVEAKGFAYALVLFALEAVVRNRWNRAWLLLGAASAFHVLVGGWSAVAAGVVWLARRKECPPLGAMLPGLIGGLLLSLPALIRSLLLNRDASADDVAKACQIYVFDRLYHHLSPAAMLTPFVVRFLAISVFWLLLADLWRQRGERPNACVGKDGTAPFLAASERPPPDSEPGSFAALQIFVAAALGLSGIGWALSLLVHFDRALCAGLLRFYWFRLADIAVPLGVALTGTALIAWTLKCRPRLGRRWLVVAVLVAGVHLAPEAVERLSPAVPPADRLPNYRAWRAACDWIVSSGEIPADACFLTPRTNQTFKWYAGRPEVVNWKEIPQDATAIVEWWQRLRNIHGVDPADPASGWRRSLTELGDGELRDLARRYGFQYVLTESQPPLELPVAFENQYYVIYRIDAAQ